MLESYSWGRGVTEKCVEEQRASALVICWSFFFLSFHLFEKEREHGGGGAR